MISCITTSHNDIITAAKIPRKEIAGPDKFSLAVSLCSKAHSVLTEGREEKERFFLKLIGRVVD